MFVHFLASSLVEISTFRSLGGTEWPRLVQIPKLKWFSGTYDTYIQKYLCITIYININIRTDMRSIYTYMVVSSNKGTTSHHPLIISSSLNHVKPTISGVSYGLRNLHMYACIVVDTCIPHHVHAVTHHRDRWEGSVPPRPQLASQQSWIGKALAHGSRTGQKQWTWGYRYRYIGIGIIDVSTSMVTIVIIGIGIVINIVISSIGTIYRCINIIGITSINGNNSYNSFIIIIGIIYRL